MKEGERHKRNLASSSHLIIGCGSVTTVRICNLSSESMKDVAMKKFPFSKWPSGLEEATVYISSGFFKNGITRNTQITDNIRRNFKVVKIITLKLLYAIPAT